MTELPPELFFPSGSLDGRIHEPPNGALRHLDAAMPATAAGHHPFARAYDSSPSVSPPPSYLPHQHPPSAVAPGGSGSGSGTHAYAVPPSSLSHPSLSHPSDFYAHSLPSNFGRSTSPSPSQFGQPTSRHPFDGSGLHRSSSLSPTAVGRSGLPPPTSQSNRPLSSLSPPAPGASLSRSVSADAAAPPQSSTQLVQRLAQQNSLIRSAWEAERNYLEANRRRAEEVYQEERAIMEDVREGWENEKAGMLQEIQTFKERIQRLEGENATLKAVAAQSVQISGVVSPLASQRGGSLSTDGSSMSGPTGFAAHRQFSQQSGAPTAEFDLLPPGLDGASRRPHFFASPGSSRMSPNLQPDTSPFIALDPRVQPQSASVDFLSSPSESADTAIPVIDVQEIDPKLEGIPIKATAVQRSTFSESSNKSSPATSPPATENDKLQVEQQQPPPQPPPGPIKRVSSKDHTVQVLAVEESRRRTMHAGHTPNHSLSLFPGLSTTGGSTATGQSEGTTPTATTFEDPAERQEDPEQDKDKGSQVAEDSPAEPETQPPVEFNEPEAILEPTDDVPLKGPLMIKNIPAQDEIFWDQVNKKLETISQDQNALPTVMQGSLDDVEAAADPSGIEILGQKPGMVVAAVGGDASNDAQPAPDEGVASPSGGKPVEADLPLKLRTTTNFGAPFGVM